MEILWVLYLTVCGTGSCLTQEVQRFENQAVCNYNKVMYERIPQDGKWKSVRYVCRPKDSINA